MIDQGRMCAQQQLHVGSENRLMVSLRKKPQSRREASLPQAIGTPSQGARLPPVT